MTPLEVSQDIRKSASHAPASPNELASGTRYQRPLLGLMMSLFFAFGFCTVLVDTLIPKLKAMFHLSYAEVMLTQFCFFLAYFIVSVPAGWLMSKVGYLRGVIVGLLVMATGCLLFTPAAFLGTYPGFLLALFIMAAGVTTVQVAANPMTASLGAPTGAHSRLTLAQAFNSVATMVGPLFGAALILKDRSPTPDPATLTATALTALRRHEAHAVQAPFFGIAVFLIALAGLCWFIRDWAPRAKAQRIATSGRLLKSKRLAFGAVSIFAYVGAEVSIGSAIANYLMSSHVLAAPPQLAGSMVSIYWGLAMVGRFIGSAVLRGLRPGWTLTTCAIGAAALASISGLSGGVVAAATILAVGLFNSIMFPTIFTLAIEGLGEETPQGSGLLCLAIVGGAIVPLVTGLVADRVGLSLALFVPVACYAWVATYGWLTGSVWRAEASGQPSDIPLTRTVSPTRSPGNA